MQIIEEANIYHLREKWNALYKESANSINPLQSFIPNKIYFNRFKFALHRLRLQPRFIYAFERESEIIVPIIIDNERKIITEFAPLDYYDVLVSGSLDIVGVVVEWLIARYPNYSISFSRVNQSSNLYRLYESLCERAEKCVNIILNNTFEGFLASLSKHQRQNIRTAYNRLSKDKVDYSLQRFDNKPHIPKKIKKACLKIYTERYASKNSNCPPIKRLYHRLSLPVFKMMEKIENGAFFVLSINDMPVAFMAGAYSKDRTHFIVPMLFSASEYVRYSPGIIMISEVAKFFISEGTQVLDLARGDEFYKYAMGGVNHNNYSIYLKTK